ncbi:unnamed protein product [Bursaphelenchus xylophilus]|uniref:(pine wood nematode) hypothetical protein n=1 Tax=Bursaphelenchus xylophilus TaxID=6326 RepID=A0A7I8X4G3_BURXY|nr:unnamed protein product [Bursaphelenchus xylophilus]CAG9128917.1 unnamed protein product [Bursaphelenchus xylophilus]
MLCNGQEPYPGMSPGETFVKVKDEQYRMTLPPCTPPEMVNFITQKCWAENPNDRYSMQELAHKLELWWKVPRAPAPSKISEVFTQRPLKKKKNKKG